MVAMASYLYDRERKTAADLKPPNRLGNRAPPHAH
jgi:hypothetical protein